MRIGPFGLPELLIILVVILLIFGARRLPEIGASLGKGIRTFKSAVTGEDDNARNRRRAGRGRRFPPGRKRRRQRLAEDNRPN